MLTLKLECTIFEFCCPEYFLSNSVHISSLRAGFWVSVWAEKKSCVFVPPLFCFQGKKSQHCHCATKTQNTTANTTPANQLQGCVTRLLEHGLREGRGRGNVAVRGRAEEPNRGKQAAAEMSDKPKK